MLDSQMKRGILEICVLSATSREDSYGYKIIKDLSAFVEVSESTLYPILRRLEKGGCLTVYTVEHNSRLRKFYRITDSGRAEIKEFLRSWKEINAMYEYIKEGMNDEEG